MGVTEYFVNEGPIKLFVFIWAVANAIVFTVNWYRYATDEYAYIRESTGPGLQIARAAANMLNLNCALILLPVCRNLVNYARGCFECKRSIRRLFDKNITFHKLCAYTICVASVMHIGAHVFNVQRLLDQSPKYHRLEDSDSWEDVLFGYVPGYTGVMITAALILIVTTAAEQIRRSYFELFWYTHHLFVVFYGALLFHGSSGFVEKQTNCCDEPLPVFKAGGAGTWMWLILPLFLYMCERFYRFYMSQTRPLHVLKVIKHHDKTPVVQVNMTKVPTIAGQYIFIHCPEVSRLEWHPFTLTSCPELDHISLHIRIVGDWTGAFAERVGVNTVTFQIDTSKIPSSSEMVTQLQRLWPKRNVKWAHVTKDRKIQHTSDRDFSAADLAKLEKMPGVLATSVTTDEPLNPIFLPKVAIDGPFGTCSEDVYRFDAAVLVGAGIGVTPYASLLQSLFFRLQDPSSYNETMKLKKVYFYWICPGFDAWGWFASLLMDLEDKLAEIGREDFLSIRVYMTRGWSDDDAAKLMLQDEEEGDLIVRDERTGRALRSKMNFGRPMWDKDFGEFSTAHAGGNVGVFFCGPKVLSSTLHVCCNRYTHAKLAGGTKFYYHKENF